MTEPQSPSAALFELIKKAFDEPGLAKSLEDCGSIFAGEFFIWEYEDEEDMYYAINPFQEVIYLTDSYDQQPKFGSLVVDEDDIELVYKDIFEYIGEYRLKKDLNSSPKEDFFHFLEGIQKSPRTLQLLEDEGGFTNGDFFVWPCNSDDDDKIYMAASSSLKVAYELNFPEQEPQKGNALFSDDDFIWLLEDLAEFVEDIPFDMPFDSFAPSPYALYIVGATSGSYHSLS